MPSPPTALRALQVFMSMRYRNLLLTFAVWLP